MLTGLLHLIHTINYWDSRSWYPHFPEGKTEAPRGPMTAKAHIHKESGRARIQSQNCLLWSRATSNDPTTCPVLLGIDRHKNKGSGAGILGIQALCAQWLKREQPTLSLLMPSSNPMSQAAQLWGERWSNNYMVYSRSHGTVCRLWCNFHLIT